MRTPLTILAITFSMIATIQADQEPDAVPPVTDKTKVALAYLKRLSEGEIDIAKHTALSEHCGIQRRKVIRTRIEFVNKNYFHKGDTLTFVEQKIDGNLAGILIRAENPATPLSTRVHAVALIKKGKSWKAAPLLGLFSNTGYGYDEKVELAVRSLERWMAREKTLREFQWREKATNAFKSTLVDIEKKAGFDKMGPEKSVARFLEQCREKNLLGILASMGGASDALEEPMETTISLISQGLENKDTSSDWHLVTSRSVIAQVLKIDNTRNEVALGFYNPLERGKSKILYFPIHSSGGKTFVRLSPLLKIAMLPQNQRWQQRWKHRHGDEDELRKKLPSTIFKNTKPVSYRTSRELLNHLLKSIKEDNFTDCLRLTPQKGDYFGKEENQSSILSNLGNLWRSIHKLKSSPQQAFDITEDKNVALAPLQYAKTNRTGEFETIKIWMIKNAEGWHLISYETLTASMAEELKTTIKKLEKRFLSEEKARQDQHARDLLDKVATLNLPITLGPVSEDDAKNLFTSFRSHLRSKDTQAALSSCAVLKGTSSTQTLKTFSYAIRGAADHTNYDHLVGATKSGKWMGLSVRTESKLVGLNEYPLYLVVKTDKGPRVMLDIDLRHATNKGRALLNKKNWRKLEEILAKDSLADVKAIFEAHTKLTVKDVEEELKLKE